MAAAAAAAAPWVQTPRDREAVASVWTYIEAKDCPGAVRTLNAGVAQGQPSVLLLAGAMFETGICLKPNWERAVDFYQRADAAGHPRAASRLASGYAAPGAGLDKAAAIWWALKSGVALPAECRNVAPLVNDPDRFVAALKAWPASRVDACTYVAGVTSTIAGDIEFSSRASAFGLKGVVTVTFEPARELVDVETNAVEFIQLPGVTSGDVMLDRQSRSVRQEFERDLREAAARAVKRYPKPSGIESSWKVTQQFSFDYVSP
jgi:hypothetical protein